MAGNKLQRWYQEILSDFKKDKQEKEDWIKDGDKYKKSSSLNRGIFREVFVPIFKPENLGDNITVDEKHIGKEVYTIVANKDTGKIIAMVESLKHKILQKVFSFMPRNKLWAVKTISKDLASNFDWLARSTFPNAEKIADKFHIIKLALEALQAVRTRYRQEVLTAERLRREAHKCAEAKRRDESKKYGTHFIRKHLPKLPLMTNNETKMELLARSRGLLFKRKDQWTNSQKERAKVLFAEFPEIKKSYNLIESFRGFYNRKPGIKNREKASVSLKKWFKKVGASSIDEVQNFASTVDHHQSEILNYFNHGHTNAFAESLNAKIQRFLINNYGIKNKKFFFFRLQTFLA